MPSNPCTFFLLHLSSPHGGRALPGTVPYGVRTFLPRLPAGDDPSFSGYLDAFYASRKEVSQSDLNMLNIDQVLRSF